jgi:cell division protease FtsH
MTVFMFKKYKAFYDKNDSDNEPPKKNGGEGGPPNGPQFSGWIKFALAILVITLLFQFFGQGASEIGSKEIPVSELQKMYEERQLDSVEISSDKAVANGKDGQKYLSYIGTQTSLNDLGFGNPEINKETKIAFVSTRASDFWTSLIISLLPIIIIVGLIAFSMRNMSSSLPFGKKGQKGLEAIKPKTNFADVAGCDEAKFELEEVVEFLKKPRKFTKMGAKIPKGVLLLGPPGTGKTLLARAVAGEAHVPFFAISGSEFVEMFVGVGASRVRALFENARKNAPAIIFIDEIDAVGRQRSLGVVGGNDEREQTLNQILTEMDGFDNETGIIVMAATNRLDILDKALLRPGRFDRRISVDIPTIKDREKILEVHSRGKPIAKEVDLFRVAARTAGFSGADLENMLNEAAIFAARENSTYITMKHIDSAIERVAIGNERKSLVMSPEEKKMTAFHEVGHAMMAQLLPHPDPVQKITIVPRGMALGITYQSPDREKYHQTKQGYFEEICVLLGGFVAEKLTFKDTTSGVSNDVKRATKIARAMVSKFAMSDDIGPMELGKDDYDGYPGGKEYSEAFAKKVDEEAQRILKEALVFTENTLKKEKKTLEKIAGVLLEKEMIDRDEFEAFFEKFSENKKNKETES